MDQRQEMMDDAIDDVTGLEDEEEGEEVVKEVLDEIGVDLGQAVCLCIPWMGERGAIWRESVQVLRDCQWLITLRITDGRNPFRPTEDGSRGRSSRRSHRRRWRRRRTRWWRRGNR